MTTAESIAAVLVALGGGGGIVAILRGLRGRSTPDADRESPVPQDRAAERSRCVTHAELAALRAELSARIDAADADCERRTKEAAEHSAEQHRFLAGQIHAADGKVERALGIIEGYLDGQAAHSRRGR